MRGEQNFWAAVKTLQDRVVVIVPLITLAVGVITSMLDKARPPVLNLAIFTVFATIYCAWVVFGRKFATSKDDSVNARSARRFHRRALLAVTAWALVVSAAWVFIFREHIAYSTPIAAVHGGPHIAITDDIAWQLLTYSSPEGEEHHTVAGELAALLNRLPYRVVVVPEYPAVGTDSRLRAVISGLAEQSGLVVDVTIIGNQKRFQIIADDLLKRAPDADRVSVPTRRLWDIATVMRLLTPKLPLSVTDKPEHRTSLFRLLLRYTVAMALYTDDVREAAPLFREMIDISELLRGVTSPALAELYWGAGFYLALHAESGDLALQALSAARRFDPANHRIAASHAWLLLALGQTEEASRVMSEVAALASDPGLALWLSADIRSEIGDHSGAVALYEKSLEVERETEMRETLHFQAAFAYARADRMDPHTAGTGIIHHSEDALQSTSKAVFHALQGYGWALVKNPAMCDTAFGRARTVIDSDGDGDRVGMQRFLAQWHAKSLLKLGEPRRARAAIEQFVGDVRRSTDVTLLVDFGLTLLHIADMTGKPSEYSAAESYFARVLEVDPQYASAANYRAVALTMQLQTTPELEAEEAARMRDAARRSFLQAIRLGFERAEMHSVLQMLYLADGDTVNADRHFERFCALGGEDKGCLLKRATDLLLAGKAVEAEPLLIEYLRLDPRSSTGHNNLAFALYELGRPDEALRHWQKATHLDPADPDALAGMAIAFDAGGNRPRALAAYKAAVARNREFLDVDVLRDTYGWSEKARRAARPLIEAIRE